MSGKDEKAGASSSKRSAAEMEAPKYHDSLLIEFLIQRSNEFQSRQEVEDAIDRLYNDLGVRKRARASASGAAWTKDDAGKDEEEEGEIT